MVQIEERLRHIKEQVEQGLKDSYEVPNNVLRDIPDPLVTVRTVTFQHAPYIRQCIEGVLMQRTNFPVELIIGEDHSTDGTREIVMEYAAKYPSRIRVITADRNVGIKANSRRTNMAQRGKYTALCEGDDHWTDPLKLQKQVDILESDPDASGCFTDAWNQRGGVRSDYISVWLGKEKCPDIVQLKDIIGRNFIPTATIMFRRLESLPLESMTALSPLGDQMLHFTLLRMGHYRYLPEYTAVREVHAGGIISMKSATEKLEANVRSLEIITELLGGEHKVVIEQRLGELFDGLVRGYWRAGDRRSARTSLKRLMSIPRSGISWKRKAKLLLFAYAPNMIVELVRDKR